MHRDNQKINVLIIEDELIIAYDIKDMLSNEYHVVEIVINYEQAMKNINLFDIDMVLLDVNLSGSKSGIDVAKELNKKDIPFIFLTALTHDDVLTQLLAMNPMAFLSKPISKVDLTSALHIGMQNHDQREIDEIIVQSGKKIFKFSMDKLIYVKSEHIYTKVILTEEEFLIRISLSNFVKQSQNKLRRINRQIAVNPKFIYSETKSYVELLNHDRFPVSKKY